MKEHIDGKSNIYIHEENETFLRVKIQSMHTSSKKYILWIRYSKSMVESWYCTWRSSARVMGMCSQAASAIIWYLSNARHKANAFGVQDCCACVLDTAVYDSSNSESGESEPEE